MAPETVALIGFMAAGKSSAGREIAKRLDLPFADADSEIESRAGMPVAEIFAAKGEGGFREIERQVCVELLAREAGGVVALGGGAVESAEIREALAGAHTVWCQVDAATAWKRAEGAKRPLAQDREQFEALHAAREPLYEELADSILPSGGRQTGAAAAPWLAEAIRIGCRLLWAQSESGSYAVIAGAGATAGLGVASSGTGPRNGAGPAPHRWFVVADETVRDLYPDALSEAVATVTVPSGEASKTLTEAERVLRALTDAGARRDDGIVAFGGGVAGDLAGFCAATFQRGVELVQVPTTLVAQVDSAYGGKTGVDLPEAKNYVGAYKMPRAVLVDPGFLETLSAAELAAGFAEVVKTALIAGGGLWERVRGIREISATALGDLVFDCARAKIAIVAADERDSGRRAVLNLGHTIGHAIETATGYEAYRHGEAVGLGMLGALRLSEADELRTEVRELLAMAGLPTRLDGDVAIDAIMAAMERDKKQTAKGLGFVLAAAPGQVSHGHSVDPGAVRAAVEELADD